MLSIIQSGILLFWGLWFALVSISDVCNFLQKTNLLRENFIYSSSNFDLISKSLAVYGIESTKLSLILFGIVTLWAIATAGSYMIAVFNPYKYSLAYISFILSLTMSGCFMLWHEIFLQYELEHSLIVRFGFQILTLLLYMFIEKNKLYL